MECKILEQRKKEVNEELIPYKAQKNEEFRNNGFSEEYYRFEAKIDELQDELYDIESELNKIDMGFYDASSDMDKMKSVPYYMFGGFIIFVSIMIGGSLLITAYRRNIMAFTAQQAIPIVKEGVDELAPVVGSAAGKIAEAASPHIKKATKEMAPVFGDIAKEISKGIKEGTKK